MPAVQAKKKTGKGITGSTLKFIAIICMTIDHVAAIILDRMLYSRGFIDVYQDEEALLAFLDNNGVLYYTDSALRCIGRLAFPVCCFLLVEGYLHTRSRKNYAIRLGIFALLSEVPFDLAFSGTAWDPSYQNVLFTLFLGVCLMMCMDLMDQKTRLKGGWQIAMLKGLPLLAFCVLATIFRTDFSAGGIILIAILYYLMYNPLYAMGIGCFALSMLDVSQIFSFLAMIPVHYYNGKRGLKLKYFFYVYYPLHMLLLYLIACWMGLGHQVML